MFISPISSASTNPYYKTQFKKIQHNEEPQPQPQQLSFKGAKGFMKGALIGGIIGLAFPVFAPAIMVGTAVAYHIKEENDNKPGDN